MGMTSVPQVSVLAIKQSPPSSGRRVREPMARRTFDVVDVTEIFIHWYAGRSISEVAVSLGVDRKTIRKYLAPAVAAGLTPGGPAMSQQDWAGLVMRWFPQLADGRLR